MRRAQVVIGASFGDEGKGLMTDYFARQMGGEGVLVARFNGGAQAGHTVETPEGVRHVFSHFGAGTFAGADTLLTRYFLVNPILFRKERRELQDKGALPSHGGPRVWVDPRALVTTPYDMLINEMVETARGSERHGSVGLGINETVTRSERHPFLLTVKRAQAGLDAVENLLRFIRDLWVPERVVALGIEAEYEKRKALLESEDLLLNWLDTLGDFLGAVEVQPDTQVLDNYESVVFEGAQGLLLDQERGTFPHVTRSNTGIKNVAEILRELPAAEVEVVYATRAYLTRHGAGPLEGELPAGEKPFPGVYDRTNVTHEFQGSLRYALLDVNSLQARIMTDFEDAYLSGPAHSVSMSMAVTCLDQISEEARWVCGGEVVTGLPEHLVDAAAALPCVSEVYVSRGPSSTDVRAGISV